MRLPDNFWSVNEDEPGIGGLIAGFAVLVLILIAILTYVVMFTPVPATAYLWTVTLAVAQ